MEEKYTDSNDEFYNNPLEEIADLLNYCRSDYYKLYKKDRKVASVRLRHNLEDIIQIAKQLKRDALSKRKEIEKEHSSDDDSAIWD